MTIERDRPDEPELPELASLPRAIDPPAALEQRMLAAFRAETAASRRSFSWRQLAAVAALVVISLAAGIAIGRRSAPAAANGANESRFMLLLWGDGTVDTDDRTAEEYRQWAAAQRTTGRRISGERLSSEAVLVDPSRTIRTVAEVEGFFIVSAANLDDAAEVARNSPYVQRGGRIIVRPIDTP